jgi:hypothetical protein
MPQTKWSTLGSIASAITTGLNSLAADARAISADLDNTSDRQLYGDWELVVTYGVAPTSGGYCSLYLIRSADDTNFADGDASTAPPGTAWVGNFPVRAVTTAQRVVLPRVLLPPGHYKAVLENKGGQAFAASGNTLKVRPYSESLE